MSFPGTSIISVEPASPASRVGLRPGDKILSCNGTPVRDWVDLLSMSSETAIELSISRGPLRRTLQLRRRPGIGWGIELAESTAKTCKNKCIFCFIDQQPPSLRRSLALKDDDVRFSFLSGTYITLTADQTEEAIARGFSSLHVSVHTTNPLLRGKMLGLPYPLDILPNIDKLAENSIDIQAQIVEVPGWNNGDELDRTIADLFQRSNISILGIVPVGLTRWRDGLEPLRRTTPDQAEETLRIIAKWQSKALEEKGNRWVYPADEYFTITGIPLPPLEFYDGGSLAANGIGLLAKMIDECKGRTFHGKGAIVTGLMAAPYISKILKNSRYTVLPVQNTLMGPLVSVAGLLSGEGVICALKENHLKEETAFLPSVMFNHNNVSLDEYTAASISEKTGINTVPLDSIGDLS